MTTIPLKNEVSRLQAQTARYISDMNGRAEELHRVRMDLKTREERYKQETDDLFKRESELREQLLEDLKVIGLKSIKVAAGDAYFISKRTKYLAKSVIHFESWARENNLVKIDNDMVKTYLGRVESHGEQLPDFIERVESESISVRKSSAKEEEIPVTV